MARAASGRAAAEKRYDLAPRQLNRIAGSSQRVSEQPCNVAECSRMSGILPVKRNGDAAVSF